MPPWRAGTANLEPSGQSSGCRRQALAPGERRPAVTLSGRPARKGHDHVADMNLRGASAADLASSLKQAPRLPVRLAPARTLYLDPVAATLIEGHARLSARQLDSAVMSETSST